MARDIGSPGASLNASESTLFSITPSMPPSQLLAALENVWISLADFPDKAIAGRLIDLADIRELLAVNRGELDFSYLEKWSKQLEVHVSAW
jgi:hypothetical protein